MDQLRARPHVRIEESQANPLVWIDDERWAVTRVGTRTEAGKPTRVWIEFIPASLAVHTEFPSGARASTPRYTPEEAIAIVTSVAAGRNGTMYEAEADAPKALEHLRSLGFAVTKTGEG